MFYFTAKEAKGVLKGCWLSWAKDCKTLDQFWKWRRKFTNEDIFQRIQGF